MLAVVIGFGLIWPISLLHPWSPELAWFGALVFWMSLSMKLAWQIDEIVNLSRVAPLWNAIETFVWNTEWNEVGYLDRLLERLHAALQLRQKAERPLESGSRVDLWASFRDVDWYITIKKELDNQKRLTIQGEAAGIIDEIRRRKLKRSWVLIMIGVAEDQPGKQESYIAKLDEHLVDRWRDLLSERQRHESVNYSIVRVPVRVEPSEREQPGAIVEAST